MLLAGWLITLILLFPLRTRVVPPWTVRVTDPSGAPVVEAVVRPQWKYEPFDGERHEGSALTRRDGSVSFPGRYLRMSLAERGVALAAGLLRAEAHPDWGRTSLLVASAPGRELDAAAVSYSPGETLPAEIRLTQRPSAWTNRATDDDDDA